MVDEQAGQPNIEEYAAALAAATNPATDAAELASIAADHPSLRARVAAHPNAYPGLLEWLSRHGDIEARGIVAARRPSKSTEPEAQRTDHRDTPPPTRRHDRIALAAGVAVALVVCGGIAVLALSMLNGGGSSAGDAALATTGAPAQYKDPKVRWARTLDEILAARVRTGAQMPEDLQIVAAWPVFDHNIAVITAGVEETEATISLSAAVNTKTGQVLWARDALDCAGYYSPSLVCADYSTVPAGTRRSSASARLAFVDPATGRETGSGADLQPGDRLAIPGPGIYSGSCHSDSGMIYASRYLDDGSVSWRQQKTSPGSPGDESTLATSSAGIVVRCGVSWPETRDGGSRVFRAASGEVVDTGDYAAVGWLPEGRIRAIELDDTGSQVSVVGLSGGGQLDWSYPSDVLIRNTTDDAMVYVQNSISADERRISRLDPTTGTPLWTTSGSLQNTLLGLADVDNAVLFPDSQNTALAGQSVVLDSATGATIWSIPATDARVASVARTALLIVVVDGRGQLRGFDRSTGEERWHLKLKPTDSRIELVSTISGILAVSGSAVQFVS